MKICLILVLAIVGYKSGYGGYGGYKTGYGGYGYRNGEEKQKDPETVTPEGRQKEPEMETPEEGRQKEPETETTESPRKPQEFREPLPRNKELTFTHTQGSESNEFKWHESSSSSEEQTNQEGDKGKEGCHWPCRFVHHHCFCPHDEIEEPTNPTKPDEGSDEGDISHYCIHAHCFPPV